MAIKKKSVKRKVTRRAKKKPEIDIKIRNLDKGMYCGDGMKNRKMMCGHHGNCWIFGSSLAMVLSYVQNSSILYAILHGVLSWFYVIYRAMMIWGWF
ncbi:hypothetical protein GOV13_02250 [Candidatus Pacearchaeota archaeon]|nr:hypothetical protein [Candidatus Pacearchaeota archaeon]